MRVFTAPGLAGFMARRLIGAVFVVPMGLGWFFLVLGRGRESTRRSSGPPSSW